jgi:type I restriction enzyme M protein
MLEERSGEDDILEDINGDTDKITKTDINTRIEEYKEICIEYYFSKEKQQLNELANKKENYQYDKQQLEESEEGVDYFNPLINNKGNLTKKNIQDRVLKLKKIISSSNEYSQTHKEQAKKIKKDFGKVAEWQQKINDPIFKELDFLHQYLVLLDQEAKLKKEEKAKRESLDKKIDEKKTSSSSDSVIKDLIDIENYLTLINKKESLNEQIKSAQSELEKEVIKKYQELTVEEIKTLVVDDKWLPTLWEAVRSEMERISQRLAQRIQDLAERYDEPLPQLEAEAETLTQKVEHHLHLMMEN